jgi:hypothetical protein
LHPLVPLAHALADRGDVVRLACAQSFLPSVRRHGFEAVPAGIDFQFSDTDYFPKLVAEAGVDMPDMARMTGHDRHAWVTNNLFIRAVGRQMLPDLLTLAETWRPDLIVRESSEFSGCVAAEALGLPHASVAAGADGALDLRETTVEALAPLRTMAGLAPDADAAMTYRHLHLSFMPAAFFGADARFPGTTAFVRHIDAPRPGISLPPGWDAIPPDRPIVVASLGTIFFRTPGLHEAIVDGLGGEELELVMGIGHEHDSSTGGAVSRSVPSNVCVVPYLPMPAMLARAAVFVTHGGFNSVKEAVSAGVPMVVVPVASDQHYSADRAEELGVGRVIRPHERTPERIREQVRAVLADPSYRDRARALAAEMASLPPIGHAIGLLDRLARARGSCFASSIGPRGPRGD